MIANHHVSTLSHSLTLIVARPRVYNERRVQTAFRIPESLLQRLQAEADAREVSANYLVVKAIESHLKELAGRADAPVRSSRG